MSGGSFDYLCFKVEESSILDAVDDLRRMESFLRSSGKLIAADEVYAYILTVEALKHHLYVAGERISDLLYATEWWASGDYGPEAVDVATRKLVGLPVEE